MTGQRVGVVGDPSLAEAVSAAGGVPIEDGRADVALVVAAGEAALVDVARAGVDVPVLPVGDVDGVRSVAPADAAAAIARVLDGTHGTLRHPVVSTDGPAAGIGVLFDVALMAAEPARISEFAVHRGDERVARFRADGVVASTPAGSAGYNRAVDGPVVAPETDVVAVVPVAPFATDADRWVLPIEEVSLSVVRDETPVELLADGRRERTIAAGAPVSLSHVRDLRTVAVPEGEPFF